MKLAYLTLLAVLPTLAHAHFELKLPDTLIDRIRSHSIYTCETRAGSWHVSLDIRDASLSAAFTPKGSDTETTVLSGQVYSRHMLLDYDEFVGFQLDQRNYLTFTRPLKSKKWEIAFKGIACRKK